MSKGIKRLEKSLVWDIKYSFRRYAVDRFYFKEARTWNKNAVCVDVGGKKAHKKGAFILEDFIEKPIYVNIDPSVDPDILCDAADMPFETNYADIIICSEVLEHVENPVDVFKEMYRVLKPGGKLYLCVPFSMHIHNLPNDYGRYTDIWWQKQIEKIGFSDFSIKKQGGYYATRLNMNKRYFKIMYRHHKRNPFLIFPYLHFVICNSLLLFREKHGANKDEVGYTTGYEMILTK